MLKTDPFNSISSFGIAPVHLNRVELAVELQEEEAPLGDGDIFAGEVEDHAVESISSKRQGLGSISKRSDNIMFQGVEAASIT